MRTFLASLFLRLFGALSLGRVRALGRLAGWLLYRVDNRELRNARTNIRLCFPELSAQEQEELVRSLLIQNAMTIMEVPGIWRRSASVWRSRIDVGENEKEPRRLLSRGKGLIVAVPHLGNWEVGSYFFSTVGPTTALYRPPREKALEGVIVQGRTSCGIQLLPTTARGIKGLYNALYRGEIVAILPDQQPKHEGPSAVFAPFFGVPTLTMTLVNRLARKIGSPVLFAAFFRDEAHDGFRLECFEAGEDIAHQDPVVAATELNRCVEACVRRQPDQYQWTYKRFHMQPGAAPSPYR